MNHEGTNKQNAKLGQTGSRRGMWPTFEILVPPTHLMNGWS